MNEEIQEIDRLTKQVGDLADSLIRYARKLQDQRRHPADPNQERSESFTALLEKPMGLGACSGVVSEEMEKEGLRYERQAHVEAGIGATNGTSTPQDAVIELLRVGVADKTMSPDSAAKQSLKLLPSDLLTSKKIEIRQQAKAAFEAGDDVVSKVRLFLRNGQQHVEQIKNLKKRAISQLM